MSLWQRSMIILARSERTRRAMQRLAGATPRARRFVGGDSPRAAVATARQLRDDLGISSSLFYLGEYVTDPVLVERNVEMTIAMVELLGAEGLNVNVSVDPTALGYLADEDLCRRNAERIARAVAIHPARSQNYMMLDAEDLSLAEPTLRLHLDMLSRGLPAAVTLQARLRRTERDLRPLLQRRTAVRLVKGAFPLGPEHDHQGRRAITERYLALAKLMLSREAREAGFYPIFATHDDALTRRIIELARAGHWDQSQYEFELLYGVRSDWQQELRAQHFSVRVYLPFGTDWGPYALRRVGENPRNVLMLGRALFGSRYRAQAATRVGSRTRS